jgi:hypothetical protein
MGIRSYTFCVILCLTFLLAGCQQDDITEVSAPDPAEETAEIAEPQEVEVQQPVQIAGEDGYAVSEEEYNQTFTEIELLISELNTIIADGDYRAWLDYLTEEYSTVMSQQTVLRELSDMPILRRYTITLRSLRDYFDYVVVPSRSNARLDEIVFLAEDRVKALMLINDEPTILYFLERQQGRWLIGLLESPVGENAELHTVE